MKSKIFIDMDGVLCDFFGEISKKAGMSYKKLSVDEFFKVMSREQSVEKFFLELPEFRTNNVLIKKIIDFAGEYHICTAPLVDPREPIHTKRNVYFARQSIYGKHAWIQRHLEPQPVTICIAEHKYKEAPAVEDDGTRNILIDDRKYNTEPWEKAGGIAIKFQADEHVDDPNLEFIDKELRRVEKELSKSKSTYDQVVKSFIKKYKGD